MLGEEIFLFNSKLACSVVGTLFEVEWYVEVIADWLTCDVLADLLVAVEFSSTFLLLFNTVLCSLEDRWEVFIFWVLDFFSVDLFLAKLRELSILSDWLSECEKRWDWDTIPEILSDWLIESETPSEILRLLEVDRLCTSELLILFSFSVDLLFTWFETPVWVLSDTDPTIWDLASTEVCAAYTRSLGKIAISVVPVPKLAANAASSLI